MKLVKLDRDLYSLASKWPELTNEQILFLAKLLLQDGSFTKLKVIYCLYLMGLNLKYSNPVYLNGEVLYYVKHSRTKVYLLSLEQIYTLVAGIEWIFYNQETPEGKQVSINPRLTANPVRDIKIRFTKLRGPDDALGNITYIEFMFAETYLYRYESTKDSKWLAMFIATLWRPLKKGTVEPFDQTKLERWAHRTARIKPHVAMTIRWYYSGCKYFLSLKYPRVFGGAGDGKPKDPFEGYMKLATTLSSADATKTNDLMYTSLYFALSALDVMIEASEKTKSK
jgi:hypothetical protein